MLKKGFFQFIALTAGLGVVIWLAFPFLTNALPRQIRQRLPHQVLVLIQTPLPTALPAPDVTAVPIRITIPPLPTITQITKTLPTSQPTNFPTYTPTPSPTATPSPTRLPVSALIAGISNTPQKFNNCGPANLSLTLEFYGHTSDQLDIAAILKPNEDDRNVSPHEMAAYVNEQTSLRARIYSGGDLDLLKRLIAAGFPVIVEKGLLPSEWEGWMGHYLTVYGYDDAIQEFTSMDTYLGPWDGGGHTDSYETMAEFWSHFNFTFILVYPPERETAVHTLLGLNQIDPQAMWQHAAHVAQKELDTSPDNAFTWFNLGTSLTYLGGLTGQPEYYQNAAAAFDQARIIGLPWRMLWYQFQPYEAYLEIGRYDDVLTLANTTRAVEESFLYKGHALLATGNQAGATAAYQQALQLNPSFLPAQQALAD